MDPQVNPDYAQGNLVTVATFINSAEAEAVRNMLAEEGVPGVVSGAGAMGETKTTLLVPKSGYERALELVFPESA